MKQFPAAKWQLTKLAAQDIEHAASITHAEAERLLADAECRMLGKIDLQMRPDGAEL